MRSLNSEPMLSRRHTRFAFPMKFDRFMCVCGCGAALALGRSCGYANEKTRLIILVFVDSSRTVRPVVGLDVSRCPEARCTRPFLPIRSCFRRVFVASVGDWTLRFVAPFAPHEQVIFGQRSCGYTCGRSSHAAKASKYRWKKRKSNKLSITVI